MDGTACAWLGRNVPRFSHDGVNEVLIVFADHSLTIGLRLWKFVCVDNNSDPFALQQVRQRVANTNWTSAEALRRIEFGAGKDDSARMPGHLRTASYQYLSIWQHGHRETGARIA